MSCTTPRKCANVYVVSLDYDPLSKAKFFLPEVESIHIDLSAGLFICSPLKHEFFFVLLMQVCCDLESKVTQACVSFRCFEKDGELAI